jgi:hypothetical protein
MPVGQSPELLEAFDLLQGGRAQSGELQQVIPPIHVKTYVPMTPQAPFSAARQFVAA